jgi:hypothetical protein
VGRRFLNGDEVECPLVEGRHATLVSRVDDQCQPDRVSVLGISCGTSDRKMEPGPPSAMVTWTRSTWPYSKALRGPFPVARENMPTTRPV